MSWGTVDDIDRTAKILVDTNQASNPEEAQRILRSFVLQVAVGPELADQPAAQAALATVVNAGARAFLGGVRVRFARDPVLSTGWGTGERASELVQRYGGTVGHQHLEEYPTLVIGAPTTPVGGPILHLTWNGWAAAVVESPDRLPRGAPGTELAGVASAALGVSEAFQHKTGDKLAGRRDVGLSLWRPDLGWSDPEAVGPRLEYLPAGLWLLGLGHLGQAYAWTLGMLPYATPEEVLIGLVDFDTVVKGNTATQLLATPDQVGRPKTRVVAEALEGRGFATRLVERPFDQHFHPTAHADPARNEPRVALAGFDDVEPRRLLGNSGFDRVVDAGLGRGAEYLDTVIHCFPAADDPAVAFGARPRSRRPLGAAYEAEVERQVAAGHDETSARCGMLDIAGVTVGAAFVGALAGALVVADIVRVLHGGESYSVIGIDLRAPDQCRAALNGSPGEAALAYTGARHAPLQQDRAGSSLPRTC